MDDILPCPRCAAPLDPHDIEGFEVERCTSCRGLLVEQRDLSGLMDALVRLLAVASDPDDPIVAVEDTNGPATCPDCSKTMERFGYLETRLVTLDRCRSCWLIWIDDGELATMVALVARTSERAATQHREREEWARHLSRVVFAGAMTG